MIDHAEPVPEGANHECRSSGWVRAGARASSNSMSRSARGSAMATAWSTLADAYGKTLRLVRADRSGVVIGQALTPLVNRGDALVHIAY